MTDWLDVAGAAAYLRVHPSYIRRLVLERRVRYHKLGKYLRFTAEDLDALVLFEPGDALDLSAGQQSLKQPERHVRRTWRDLPEFHSRGRRPPPDAHARDNHRDEREEDYSDQQP